jgi:cob(I)alamin adenosyltransferase
MKLMNARIASMKSEIVALQAKVEKMDDFLLRGMERQLSQVRESSLRVIVDGQEREQKA